MKTQLLATFTTSPKTSSLSTITSPVWIPARTFKSVSVLDWKLLQLEIFRKKRTLYGIDSYKNKGNTFNSKIADYLL